ncbi:MucR family transcriptional regulator [Methylobacterium haplocladii]|uniref:MucR family transcriptional regulator n=1 Tax=Methylobacterium haplocladii TaxID=1176176 RepID=UPI001AEF0DDD|nr:MucR family transcriptional regulator [Methylobacterium haplocladii]
MDLTAKIISAYVMKNHASPSEMLTLIHAVHVTISSIEAGRDRGHEWAKLKRVQESITPNALISFVDGKPYKSLKRHLASLGFDPESYREQYALPDDYPMVAPHYAARRSQIARASGLGRRKNTNLTSRK